MGPLANFRWSLVCFQAQLPGLGKLRHRGQQYCSAYTPALWEPWAATSVPAFAWEAAPATKPSPGRAQSIMGSWGEGEREAGGISGLEGSWGLLMGAGGLGGSWCLQTG